MKHRGYHPDPKWEAINYQGEATPSRDDEIDFASLDAKLAAGGYIYPEHDDAYLEECLKNLEGKGINLRDEVNKND